MTKYDSSGAKLQTHHRLLNKRGTLSRSRDELSVVAALRLWFKPMETDLAVEQPQGQDARFQAYVVPEIEGLHRVAYSITLNNADAEDLVQDTMMRAYRAIERFDGKYPRAWLLTIMRNAQVNRVRRKRPELMHDPDETMARVADESAEGADAESQLMDQEFEAPVASALAALPDKFRSVVELVDLNQLSYQEAADALGIPVGTVMSRLHRARRNIRTHIESFEGEV